MTSLLCGDMQGLDVSVLTHSVDVKHTLEQLNRESGISTKVNPTNSGTRGVG